MRLNRGMPVWHVSLSVQGGSGPLPMSSKGQRTVKAYAAVLLAEVGSDAGHWWLWSPRNIGHLRIPTTTAEDIITPARPSVDAGGASTTHRRRRSQQSRPASSTADRRAPRPARARRPPPGDAPTDRPGRSHVRPDRWLGAGGTLRPLPRLGAPLGRRRGHGPPLRPRSTLPRPAVGPGSGACVDDRVTLPVGSPTIASRRWRISSTATSISSAVSCTCAKAKVARTGRYRSTTCSPTSCSGAGTP